MPNELTKPYIVLPIDMQSDILRSLSPKARQGLTRDMRDFIAEAEPLGVSFQWAVFDVFASIYQPQYVGYLLNTFGLIEAGAQAHHGLISKNKTDLFCVPDLPDHLGRDATLVFCGLYATGCVLSSLCGALKTYNPSCIVITDLLASVTRRRTPENYQEAFEEALIREGLGGKVRYHTRDTFIRPNHQSATGVFGGDLFVIKEYARFIKSAL